MGFCCGVGPRMAPSGHALVGHGLFWHAALCTRLMLLQLWHGSCKCLCLLVVAVRLPATASGVYLGHMSAGGVICVCVCAAATQSHQACI